MSPLSISEFIASDVVRRLQQDRNRLITCSVIIILNCIARLILEILQIIHHIRDYFLHVINYMEGVLYVATIIFVSNFQLHCLPSWQWQLGAICIFLSWINFILFLSEQPAVGSDVSEYHEDLPEDCTHGYSPGFGLWTALLYVAECSGNRGKCIHLQIECGPNVYTVAAKTHFQCTQFCIHFQMLTLPVLFLAPPFECRFHVFLLNITVSATTVPHVSLLTAQDHLNDNRRA